LVLKSETSGPGENRTRHLGDGHAAPEKMWEAVILGKGDLNLGGALREKDRTAGEPKSKDINSVNPESRLQSTKGLEARKQTHLHLESQGRRRRGAPVRG